MSFSRRQLVEIIGERTMQASDSKALARSIAAFLVEERHVGDLDALMRAVWQYRADHGAVEAVTVSAHQLTKEVVDDVKTLLRAKYPGGKKLQIEQRLQPDLVGGLRIDLPDQQLDLSVAARLNTFKRQLAKERG